MQYASWDLLSHYKKSSGMSENDMIYHSYHYHCVIAVGKWWLLPRVSTTGLESRVRHLLTHPCWEETKILDSLSAPVILKIDQVGTGATWLKNPHINMATLRSPGKS